MEEEEWPHRVVTRRAAVLRDEGKKVPRGHVPVVTSSGERVVLPVRLLAEPEIAELLDMAAQRYGYDQPGVLRIPCAAGLLRRVINSALQRAD